MRSIGLLLLLAASIAGFMMLIDLLADTTPQDARDLLAEADSDADVISLPSSGSLFAVGLATMAIIIALAVVAAPSNWRRSQTGLPRPRWVSLGIAGSVALMIAAVGLFLAFADASPLFQQQTGAEGAGHEVKTNWVAPAGVALLAAFFFTVILIGFLRPRLILPVLAIWLAASLFFGFFSSSAIAGLNLFDPPVSIKAPDAFADEVARHRTVVIPPGTEDEGIPGPGDLDDPRGDGAQEDFVDGAPGGVGGVGENAPGEVSEEALIARLNDAPDPADRADAAEKLAEYGSDDALQALAQAGLYDPSGFVRDEAIGAIGEWDFETLVEILQEHPEATVRRAAAAALGRLDDSRAVEPLATALLTDEDAEVRQESAKALRRLRDVEAVSPLIQALLQDDVSSVRAEAAGALGALGDDRAVRALLGTLQDDASALAREAGAKALGRIRGSTPLAELDAARVDDLSADVRLEASVALRTYRVDELIDALHNAPAADDRAVAARLLGERKPRAAIPELILALSDPEEIVREAAREALGEFGELTPLENGASVLSLPGGAIGLVPGTTARRAENLPQPETALFVVEGAANTTFLRTSVGEVFDGADWYRQRSLTEFYGELERINSDELPGAPFSHLEGFDRETIRMTPEEALGLFPVGLLPVPLFLETISADGAFELVANTFISYEDRRLLETASSIPVYSGRELANTATINDEALVLPDTTERVRQLAHQITAGYDSPYRKAQAIRHYLTQNYEYGLKDSSEADVPEGHDLVDWFLFESRIGTCGTFSSAFAILARSVGLPARVVSGWLIVPTEDRQVVYADQAHQIAEILFEGYGWVPFEATPGGGPASRAENNFQEDQLWESDVQEDLQELVEDLSSDDANDVRNAQRALEQRGATVTRTETGGSVVQQRGQNVAFPPSTTTQQATRIPRVGVFTVTGAEYTDHLITATGDVYENGIWRQLDPVLLEYPSKDPIPEVVLDAIDLGGEPWDSLGGNRLNPYLLAPDFDDFERVRLDRIRIAPLTEDGRIPAGVIPVSRHLNFMEREGVYAPFSGVFSMNEPAPGYQWWSIIPVHSRQDLQSADVILDSTYTELPSDLPGRIRRLAREITDGWGTPYLKAKALETYLKTRYTYRFADNSTTPPPPGHDPVDWFLFESREGTCGQFSSAFTVLARSIGLPARVASGWVFSPSDETQVVYANQAHQWAEIAFEGIGWVTFEPTAPGSARTRLGLSDPEFFILGERTLGPQISPTVTNITSWPREIERGRPFIVGGTVRTVGGAVVSGMDIEIFVNETKENGGLRVGSGTVRNGRYSIELELPPSMERGRYQLIAHAIGNDDYYESWSDPDIAVFSKSGLVFSGPQEVNVGTEAVFRGQVTEDTGRGVPGIPVSVIIDGRAFPQRTTGEDGSFSFSNTFLLPGRHWAEVRFADTDYLRANSARLNLQAYMPTTLTLNAPVQARVDEPFTVSGTLIDWRQTPLNGRQVTINVGENESATVVAGVDGSFTHQVTLPSSGQVTVTAAYEGTEFILSSSASSKVIARDVTVLSFEGPGQILAGEAGLFRGTVTSPTNDELEPLTVEILNDGEVITAIQTGEDGTFSYDTGSLGETGPRMLTARVPEQEFLTSSAATIAFSVVHPTIITLDGPPIAMTGQHIEFVGTLRRGDGQPIADASVLLDDNPVITADDGTFSHVVTLPGTLGGVTIEERIGIQYDFEGTDHLAPASGSRSIIVGVPRITAERIAPVARGDVALLRGTAFAGTRPLPGTAVSLTGGQSDETGPAGQFLFEYQVPPNTPVGPLRLTAELDGLGINAPIELDVRSATHLDAMPLDDVRPGRVIDVQVALYNDTGAGVSSATLRTSTGLDLLTDEFGHALFELTVPESESLLAVPVTFTFGGDARHMPLNQFLGIPVSPPSFNWLLWVVLPALLILSGAGGYGAYRLRAAGVPLDARRWSVSGIQTPMRPSEAETEEPEGLSRPIATALELRLSGPGAETGNVFGLDEEVVVTGRLFTEDGASVAGRSVELREPLGDIAVFDTDASGEFRVVLRAEERGEFSLSAQFEGDPSHIGTSASISYRVVEFREEMVRVFGEFTEWAAQLDIGIAGQSPRETEALLVASGAPIDQRALDELVTRFEEADYSEHDIERRHYEAIYNAWRTIVGE
ncbi:MAG: hypothetical protein F4X20_06465 [Dehalococcoidia bacterium]|nr:hypothetical protein [Dehalococcoidia bacterium]